MTCRIAFGNFVNKYMRYKCLLGSYYNIYLYMISEYNVTSDMNMYVK